MGRWNPDARGRLERAAYELFLEHGYDATTVADIAVRADLTERTFFRHYSDKREVIFGGTEAFATELRRAVGAAAPQLSSIAKARLAVEAITTFVDGRHAEVVLRQRIVDSHAELQERALIKRAALTTTLADALRSNGTEDHAATLAAEMGMAIFFVGFERWLSGPASVSMHTILGEEFKRLMLLAQPDHR